MPKIAVVTGASRGLGLATSAALARAGCTVIMTGRNAASVGAAAEGLRAHGLPVESQVLDVTAYDSARCAAEAISGRHGQVDILVNNAGILPEATANGASNFVHPAAAEDTLRTNVLGPLLVTEAMLPLLRRSAAGRIVNVSTTMGSLADQADPASPYYGLVVPAYQASKAALNSVTISLAKALAGTPVKVTSVCPGFVQTDLTPVNRQQAPLTPDDAVAVVVRAAMLDDAAPRGTFIDASGPVRW
jgi:NAD(P)-dependent dehydrogenase (short-subunit alcohol dehydrogenase family)